MTKTITINVKKSDFFISSQKLSDYIPSTKPLFNNLINDLKKMVLKKCLCIYLGFCSFLGLFLFICLEFTLYQYYLIAIAFIFCCLSIFLIKSGGENAKKRDDDFIFNKNKSKFDQFYVVTDDTPFFKR